MFLSNEIVNFIMFCNTNFANLFNYKTLFSEKAMQQPFI